MFQTPAAFALLALIPILIVFFFWRERVARRRSAALAARQLLDGLQLRADRWRARRDMVLGLIVITLLVTALAGPAWGLEDQVVDTRGIAVLVVLDVSASMDAEDVLPSRLGRAKLAAREIYAQSAGDELGLVLFAGAAIVQLPLTNDATTAITFLNAASTRSITQQGTALEEALNLALQTLDSRIAAQSAILLLTDGESHTGDATLAAQLAADQGIPIHVVGYGSENQGAPIPLYDLDGNLVGYKNDSGGNIVLTRLDSTTLREIARISGGTYRTASPSGVEVVDIVNEITRLEDSVLGTRRTAFRVNRAGIFVGLAVLFLGLQIIWPVMLSTRKELA
jgi:Ca-activated chloride channel family protein